MGAWVSDVLMLPISAVTLSPQPRRPSQPAIHLAQTHFKAIHYLTSSWPWRSCKRHSNWIIWSNLKLIQTKFLGATPGTPPLLHVTKAGPAEDLI